MVNFGSPVHTELVSTITTVFPLTSTLKNRFELAMHQDISVTPNRGGEVCVKRDAKGVVTIFGDIQHSGTEIFGTLGGFEGQQLEHHPNGGIGDCLKGFHYSPRG